MNIRDIAKMADVSVSTVSKILNHKDQDISEETRKKVLQTIKDCQYVPYSKIRENANLRSCILGAILCGGERENQKLACYLEREARRNGYSLLVQFLQVSPSGQNILEELKKAFGILHSKSVEGILFLPPEGCADQAVNELQKENIPLLVLNYTQNTNVLSVGYDPIRAGYLATNMLIQAGHQNIGCILRKGAVGKDVQEGYAEALFKHDISMKQDKIIVAETIREDVEIATKVFLNMNVSGIVCQDEAIACSVYNTLHEAGVQIPREISVISARDSQICTLLSPQLHAVEIPYYKIAVLGVEKLIDYLENGGKTKHYTEIINPILHERSSVSQPQLGKSGTREKIVVVGSMNMDMVVKVPELPKDGQTLLAYNMQMEPGGKGANQAVGVGKLGGYVYMIGRLGSDNEGRVIYNNLVQSSVKTDGVVFDKNAVSGRAYINVAPRGESTIVVHRGANQNLDVHQIHKFQYLFEGARFCLLSLEIPQQTADFTLSVCEKHNVQVMLKPATVSHIPEAWLPKISYFIPNENEINRLLPGDQPIEEKAEYFYKKGVANVIVTLGSNGAYIKNRQYAGYVSSMDVEPLDTTGAADAFISALAVSLCEGNTLAESIGFASCSAGISITRAGVQPALPDHLLLDAYRDEIALLSEIREEK